MEAIVYEAHNVSSNHYLAVFMLPQHLVNKYKKRGEIVSCKIMGGSVFVIGTKEISSTMGLSEASYLKSVNIASLPVNLRSWLKSKERIWNDCINIDTKEQWLSWTKE